MVAPLVKERERRKRDREGEGKGEREGNGGRGEREKDGERERGGRDEYKFEIEMHNNYEIIDKSIKTIVQLYTIAKTNVLMFTKLLGNPLLSSNTGISLSAKLTAFNLNIYKKILFIIIYYYYW